MIFKAILSKLINRNHHSIINFKRRQLCDVSLATIEDFSSYLLKSEKILVMSGAGLSTASGIPDFR